MGYQTDFYGKLAFTLRLTREELETLDRVIHPDRWIDAMTISQAVKHAADEERAERGGKGPLVFDPEVRANLLADMCGCTYGEDLSPYDASSMRITRDGRGLEYCSEKTYDLVAGINFIIVNGRKFVPGFGLTGSLFASTEFEPYHWLLKINAEGWAEQVPCEFTKLLTHSPRAYIRHRCLVMTMPIRTWKLPKWFSFLYRAYPRLRHAIPVDLSQRVNWEEGRFSDWWRKHFD